MVFEELERSVVLKLIAQSGCALKFESFSSSPHLLFKRLNFCCDIAGAAEIAFVTMAVGEEYRESVEKSIENKRAYAAKHGYDFICLTDLIDPTRPVTWNQIAALKQVMEKGKHKWVFWCDADALIMNFAVKIEELIYDQFDWIISLDQALARYHSGQMLLKNSPWTREFLERIYQDKRYKDVWRGELRSLVELWHEDPQVQKHLQLLPQRMCNALPADVCADSRVAYQRGDFIIHLIDNRDRVFLKDSIAFYTSQVVDEPTSIDHHLSFWGFFLRPLNSKNNEGYMTLSQKKQFIEKLQSYGRVRSVLEVGLNGGHSAAMFFDHLPRLERFFSFDICFFSYTLAAANYFQQKYRDRFTFFVGDSFTTIPEAAKLFPDKKFDLIYIDGNHRYEMAMADIQNCSKFAQKGTKLWIDDYNTFSVQMAIEELHRKRIIQVDRIHFSYEREDGPRVWAEAHYITPPTQIVEFDISYHPIHHSVHKILR